MGRGDADRILQIASNLVENALRETPAGGTVTVDVDGPRLIVSDTGPGIPAEDVPHAFERFYLYDKIGRGPVDRQRARPGDRAPASGGDGRHGRCRERHAARRSP